MHPIFSRNAWFEPLITVPHGTVYSIEIVPHISWNFGRIIIFCDSGTFAHAGHAFSQFKCSDFEIYPRVSQWRISQSIEDCHRCYQLKLSAVKCSTCKIDICRIVQLSLSPPAIPVANTIRPRPRRWKTYLSVQQLVTSIFCSSKQRQHKTWLQQLSAGWLKNV